MDELSGGFPANGKDEDVLLQQLNDIKKDDLKWKEGKAFSYVYYAEEAITETLKKAYLTYFSENALNPSAFPSLRKMENEVVDMCLDLFEAKDGSVGSMTSGGTESILMALKSAKEYAKIHQPEIVEPEVILPISAHPAFDKGCDYFGLKPIKVPVDQQFKVLVERVEKSITSNTILIVASAPSYPQGVIDPIDTIGQLALKHNLLFHVDACVGGFVLPFVQHEITKWNLSVPGVTSMSADIHKYGFASKGSSVILYNNPNLRKAQFYVYTDWPGGMYGSPAILGTKPGGAIAVAWTILQLLGRQGYKEKVSISMDITRQMHALINETDGIYLLGKSDMCIYSIASDTFDIYELGDEMHIRGWLMDRQQKPASLHMSISPIHASIFDDFKKDLQECVTKVSKANYQSIKKNIQLKANKAMKRILSEDRYKKIQKYLLDNSDVTSKRSAALYGLIGDLEGQGEADELIRNYLDKLMR